MKISISGVRGIYGEDLNLHEVHKFSSLFASYLNLQNKKIRCIIGSDTRISGRILKKIVKSSLIEHGIDVFDLDIAPTPIVFRESRKFDGGITVTASHNPYNWNGIKFIINGRGLFESELTKLLAIQPSLSYQPKRFGTSQYMSTSYTDEILELFKQSNNLIIDNQKRIGIDPGGGATCGYIYNIFKRIGYDIHDVNGIRGIFSRQPDPTTDNLVHLRSLVKSCNLDYGFSFDLDGDRLVVIDRNGEKLNSDNTLLLCIASMIHTFGMKKFVTSVDTSISIQKFIDSNGGSLIYSKVGEANVVQKMIETEAMAGGEGSSAGFIMPHFNMCRDAILASVLISSLPNHTLKECMNISSLYSQIRTKIQIGSVELQKVLQKLYDEFKSDSTEIINMDGIKIIFDENSWALIRPSNTEHVLRISTESTKNKINSIYNTINTKIMKIHDQIK